MNPFMGIALLILGGVLLTEAFLDDDYDDDEDEVFDDDDDDIDPDSYEINEYGEFD